MNDEISAFAFNTGREIEKETENLKGKELELKQTTEVNLKMNNNSLNINHLLMAWWMFVLALWLIIVFS